MQGAATFTYPTGQIGQGIASSRNVTSAFPALVQRARDVAQDLAQVSPREPAHPWDEPPAHPGLPDVAASTEHIDGSMNAVERGALLDWLSEGTDGGECRVLSNVRVLSEGVDVPTLDAVIFRLRVALMGERAGPPTAAQGPQPQRR